MRERGGEVGEGKRQIERELGERKERERERENVGDHSLIIVCIFLFRCIRFDDKRIVSGAYDGYVPCACTCIASVHLYCSHLNASLTQNALIFYYVCMFSLFRAIKVWDFPAALDPRTPADALCLRTLVVSRCCISPGLFIRLLCVHGCVVLYCTKYSTLLS